MTLDEFVPRLVGRTSLLLGEVRRELNGADPQHSSTHFAVYVSYDRFGVVHRYVVEQVAALAKAGFRIIFISHSPKSRGFDALLPHCAKIIHRRNLGHDFGAYRYGLRYIRRLNPNPGAILLMNDSCYGFCNNIDEIWAHVGDGRADLWGLTESFEYAYHLQSYFLLVSGNLFKAESFWKYWNKLPIHSKRANVIRHGEIGLTQSVLRNGFRVGALAPYEALVDNWFDRRRQRYGYSRSENDFVERIENALMTGRPVNPAHVFWEGLLEDFQAPLLKRDLLSQNPLSVPGLHMVKATVSKSGRDFSSALEHLRFARR
jgi:hypothetical protein